MSGWVRRLGAVAVTVAALGIAAFAAATPTASAAGRCGSHPWCNAALSPDQRAALLLGALTQQEKISLLAGNDLTGDCDCYANSHTGEGPGVARVGLPPVFYTDGPVGVRQGPATAMPIPIALAATFAPALARLYGGVLGNEAKLKGNDVLFGPTINILRTPLWGRAFEGFGEDPFLTAQMTIPWVQGAQSQGVIANLKHFAVYNQEGSAGPAGDTVRPGQPLGPEPVEGNRMLVNVHIDERTLREIYLPAFEAAVKQGNVQSIMCSYPRINGQYACENQHLLTEILKREWGFRGYVLSDYGAAHDTGPSLANGLDFEPWPGTTYAPAQVNLALATGQATPAQVDDHVRRILRTLFSLGFFDRAAFPTNDGLIDKQAHARAAEQVEQAGATLLVNRGGLPLDTRRVKSIAVIGSPANTFTTGGGSGNVTPFFSTTPLAAIAQRAGPRTRVRYDDASNTGRAVAAARAADVAVVFAADYETEGSDRYCLTLECPPIHGDQDSLIEQVAAANPRTIVVLQTGGPVLTPWRDKVQGLLAAWYSGEEGGPAIAHILFGDANPAGRLPETWPARAADVPGAGDPTSYPGVGENVTYKEGVFVGYRFYDQHRIAPAFPFGYGLSYTRFAYSGLKLGKPDASATQTASFTVKNIGARSGDEVAQLYLGDPAGAPVPEPPARLAGFDRISLRPGRSARVTIPIDVRSRQYWNVSANRWSSLPRCIPVLVGASSRDIRLRGNLCAAAAKHKARPRHARPRHRRAARHRPRFTG